MSKTDLDWNYIQYDIADYTRTIRALKEELRNVIDASMVAYDKLHEAHEQEMAKKNFYIERLHICLEYEQKRCRELSDIIKGYWNGHLPF